MPCFDHEVKCMPAISSQIDHTSFYFVHVVCLQKVSCFPSTDNSLMLYMTQHEQGVKNVKKQFLCWLDRNAMQCKCRKNQVNIENLHTTSNAEHFPRF